MKRPAGHATTRAWRTRVRPWLRCRSLIRVRP